MKVQLLNFTPNPEETVAQAARLCYSNKRIDQLREITIEEEANRIIKRIMKLGHFLYLSMHLSLLGLKASQGLPHINWSGIV